MLPKVSVIEGLLVEANPVASSTMGRGNHAAVGRGQTVDEGGFLRPKALPLLAHMR